MDSQEHLQSESNTYPKVYGNDGSYLVTYTKEEFPEVWDEVYDLLEDVVEHYGEDMTMGDVFHALKDGNFQLWTSYKDGKMECATLTSIQESRGNRYCVIYAAAGHNMRAWIGFYNLIEEWAKDMRCTQMRIFGRRGWARVLNMYVHSTEMRRDL